MKVFSPLFAVSLATAMFAPLVDATCTAICAAPADAGCVVSATIKTGESLTISTPADTPPTYGKYLKSLKLQTSDTTTVTFSDTLDSTAVDVQEGGVACSKAYANVGFQTPGLSKNVAANIQCNGASDCTVTYQAAWEAQDDPAICSQVCVGQTCKTSTIAKGEGLVLKSDDGCPEKFNYLQSLTVGSKDKAKFELTIGGVTPTPVAADAPTKVNSCFYQFGSIPSDISTAAANVTATVTCAESTKACTVQTDAVWGCEAPLCPGQVDEGYREKLVGPGESWKLLKPDDVDCDGKPAYPIGFAVGGPYKAYNIDVTFNNGLTPTASDRSVADCFLLFDDVVGKNAITTDMEATVTCKDKIKPCVVRANVDHWRCYGESDPEQTFTRISAEGANCATDVSDCKNRCAKTFEVSITDGAVTMTPLFAKGCTCEARTAASSGETGFTNAEKHMSGGYDPATETVEIAYTGTGEVCTTTYARALFRNKFTATTFSRKSVSPSDCEKPTDCAYKCAHEFVVTKDSDTITAARTAVTGCDCAATTAYVRDDGVSASDATATYVFGAINATAMALNTTVASKTCYSVYTTEKLPATSTPEPSASAKTGTSAGVSVLGTGAGAEVCAVTLVAAVAGVQAIGLPLL